MGACEAELARVKARVMADVAATLREVVVRLPPEEDTGDWRGPTQRAFDSALAQQRGRLRALAASSDVASDALLGLAARLEAS